MVLFRLKVGVRLHRIEAGAVAVVTEVTMPHDQGAGVTLVEILEQLSHRRLLRCRTRVVGLTADVEPALVADADRVGIVVQTVGTDHPFRPTGHDGSRSGSRCQTYNGGLCGARYQSERPTMSGRALLPNNE